MSKTLPFLRAFYKCSLFCTVCAYPISAELFMFTKGYLVLTMLDLNDISKNNSYPYYEFKVEFRFMCCKNWSLFCF